LFIFRLESELICLFFSHVKHFRNGGSMKPILTALVLALSLPLAAAPAVALGDLGSVTPSITFPEPAPKPVTQGTITPGR